MVPSLPQAPPAGRSLISASTSRGPPPLGTLIRRVSSNTPSQAPSGEKNGSTAPASTTAIGSRSVMRRTHTRSTEQWATSAPSSEIASR